MNIIPAIDIIDGKAVRLTKGDYSQMKIYNEDPVKLAKQFEDAGLKRLHLVDLDGAKVRRIQHLSLLENICTATGLQVDFGGGVQTRQDVESILSAGASMVTIGSMAVKQPMLLEEWVEFYGADKFFIGADVLNNQIRINGWQDEGGTDLLSFLNDLSAMGLNNFFCTDIAKDGLLKGASVELYLSVIKQFPSIQLTASGGIHSLIDLENLKEIGCDGAIVGKAFYEGIISLEQLTIFND